MKSFEKYKRLIKLSFSLVTILMMVTMYGYLWIGYYNKVILFPFFRRGNWMMIALYGALLVFFMKMYGGFKVGYLKKGNLIYSQILAIIFTNSFTYFQIAVLDKGFFSPFHLIVLTVADAFMIIIWTLAFQMVYVKIFPPRKMLLITGDKSDYHLMEKMNAREDKYEICEVINYRAGMEKIFSEIDKFGGVIVGDMPSHERNLIVKYCFEHSTRSYSVPKISDILLRSSYDLNLFDSPLLLSRNQGLQIEQEFAKRCLDIIGSLFGIIVSFPFFIVIAICIKLTDGGPVFYKQVRLTKGGKEFEIYKFRTMIQDAEKDGVPRLAAEGDKRILPVGRLLRRTRLDELPQIYNILKGDMSLVGPRPERPELAEELTKEIPEFPCRLKVKAGLTGYAQVYGKYNTTAYDKLKLDLTYIRSYSFLLDLKLIIMTPKILFLKESTEGVKE
ncbi:exopolysaccharide biosynthesis polyprenyl glycosylphosphotransferase [Clostridium sp. MCC353]|uniref:exopolysaccharide biosynthesis polyprenyl glycosylphosphotransferase n=1 Tax=Clostridium sp. MCC353 TaxID=2592646 RepID=UPI001C0195B7|nr:exopolysaccharide biosynthesis polyprenyl glycosylphosphotransferase [Clostridium sp. MCC353]MBT9778349.1 exopolysaccharide biosynthesis polyprenyl glycosylphosphotransferase [Clostridium sp. MCC353]